MTPPNVSPDVCVTCRGRGTCLRCQGADKWHYPSLTAGCDHCFEGVCAGCAGFGRATPAGVAALQDQG